MAEQSPLIPVCTRSSWYSEWNVKEGDTIHAVRSIDVYTWFCYTCSVVHCRHTRAVAAEVEAGMDKRFLVTK